MRRRRKRTPAGYSLFWRKDRKRWCLQVPSATGWKDPITKFAPKDIGKREVSRAERWAETFMVNAEQLELFPRKRPNGITLRMRFPEWKKLRENAPKTSPATLASYDELFRNVVMRPFKDGALSFCLGDEDVVALGTDLSLIRRWIRAITKTHSPARVHAAFSALRSFYEDALVEKWFRGVNPMRNDALVRELPPKPTTAERGGVVYLEAAPAQALVTSPYVPLRRRARYVVVLTTGGLRDGEIAGATWGDLLHLEDPQLARLEVRKARRLRRAADEVRGPLKRRTSFRVVPLHPAAREALLEWRDDPEHGIALYLGRRPLPSDPIFPSARPRDRGAFARPRSARLVREDLEATGLPTTYRGSNLTFHALRASFGTWLYELDAADEITRKRLMGHGMQDVTAEFYTGEAWRKMVAAVARIPLTWARGVGYIERPRRPRAPTGIRPGTLTARVLAFAREHPEARSPAVARALGARESTTAYLMSRFRADGLLPSIVSTRDSSSVSSRRKSGGAHMGDMIESRLRDLNSRPTVYETVGQQERGASPGPRDTTKSGAATLLVDDPNDVNDRPEELSSAPGRDGPPRDGNDGRSAVHAGPAKARERVDASLRTRAAKRGAR